jgi:hypothetical protein
VRCWMHWRDQARQFARGVLIMAQPVVGLRWPTDEKIFTGDLTTARHRRLTRREG